MQLLRILQMQVEEILESPLGQRVNWLEVEPPSSEFLKAAKQLKSSEIVESSSQLFFFSKLNIDFETTNQRRSNKRVGCPQN